MSASLSWGAAIAPDSATLNQHGGFSGTFAFNYTVGSDPNRILFAGIAFNGAPGTLTATYGGTAMILVDSVADAANGIWSDLFVLTAAGGLRSGSNSLSFSIQNGGGISYYASARSYAGASGNISSHNHASAYAGSGSVALTASTNDWYFVFAGVINGAGGETATGGGTLLAFSSVQYGLDWGGIDSNSALVAGNKSPGIGNISGGAAPLALVGATFSPVASGGGRRKQGSVE